LKKTGMEFSDKFGSKALFKVFIQIAKGENYVTKIARKLRKSKAIVSRQVRELSNAHIVRVEGEGVKQVFRIDWEVLTFYWIDTFAPAPVVVPDIWDEITGILSKAKVPRWMGRLYLNERETKILESRKRSPESVLEEKLIPVIQSLAPIVEVLVKIGESEDFYDCFRFLSTSFALGLPRAEELGIRFDEIENEELRKLLETLYSTEVRMWLKMQAFYEIYGANLVRNFIFDKLGLLEKK